jgi:hypothetical protein
MLEPSEGSKVRDAIVIDTAITERQKQVLLDVYSSFCEQNEAAQAIEAEVTTEEPAAPPSTI